jgi:hypothetical protein
MFFLILIALIVIIWLLWTLCRNTGDALDKQTALQYEIVALEKRIEQLVERFPAPSAATPEKQPATPARKRPVRKAAPAKKAAPAAPAAPADSDETPTS